MMICRIGKPASTLVAVPTLPPINDPVLEIHGGSRDNNCRGSSVCLCWAQHFPTTIKMICLISVKVVVASWLHRVLYSFPGAQASLTLSPYFACGSIEWSSQCGTVDTETIVPTPDI